MINAIIEALDARQANRVVAWRSERLSIDVSIHGIS
jgi:hypothetical protein